MEHGDPENTQLEILARQLNSGVATPDDYRKHVEQYGATLLGRVEGTERRTHRDSESVLDAASQDLVNGQLSRTLYRQLVQAVANGHELERLGNDSSVSTGQTYSISRAGASQGSSPFNWVWWISLSLSIIGIFAGLWWLALIAVMGAVLALGQAPTGRKAPGGCLLAFAIVAIFIAGIIGFLHSLGA